MTAIVLERTADEFLGELTDAAYQLALRYGLRGPFVDFELQLWHALRAVLRSELSLSKHKSRREKAPPEVEQ